MSTTVHVRITGRVQGVGFRAWTAETAHGLGLDGWVRNCRDGSVEAMLSGEDAAVEQMLDLCRHGPPAAQVTRMESESSAEPAEPGFRMLPTA